jgi:hypothetical protein
MRFALQPLKGARDVVEDEGKTAANRVVRADHGNADQSHNEPVLDRSGSILVLEQFVQYRRQPKFLHNMSSSQKVEGRIGRAGETEIRPGRLGELSALTRA